MSWKLGKSKFGERNLLQYTLLLGVRDMVGGKGRDHADVRIERLVFIPPVIAAFQQQHAIEFWTWIKVDHAHTGKPSPRCGHTTGGEVGNVEDPCDGWKRL
jgi:hypothetical protein